MSDQRRADPPGEQEVRPPIPVRYPESEVRGGLAMPWVNARLADGGTDLRTQHGIRAQQAWRDALCQLDGQQIDAGEGAAFVGGPSAMRDLVFHEPPMHRECVVYASRACPVLAGRWSHFPSGPALVERARGKVCFEPGCDCGGYVPAVSDQGPRHAGKPNHPWWVVFASDYALAVVPDEDAPGGRRIHGGVLDPARVSGARLVSHPDRGRVWEKVPDLLELRRSLAEDAVNGVRS